MHIADEAAVQAPVETMTDRERIEALEAEVAALKASNACLVQSLDYMKAEMGSFFRMSQLHTDELGKMAARLAGVPTTSFEMTEPG